MSPAAVIAVTAIVFVVACFVTYWVLDIRARMRFERWKAEHSERIGREAIRGSQSALTGRVSERVAPYLPEFGFNPRDARFLGDPVDFVVFDGLSEGEVRGVIFVEVKTGRATLNGNERLVRSAVQGRRVDWCTLQIGGPAQAPRPSARRRS